ncbi:chloroplast stem-loop binding protein of 41 kDa b, chloroplastic [Senna tora]|uniref:Chloroplast stem-loop binding protein of 41 kDa b, chloroplastic n=1 Tax=Senna tora TaxID=362788 RepID=A0A834WB05_9FABA|nr:chloroplast stem-loop binding protein of 41 kDa b, chloroplastic [Senna tora]
MDNMILPNIEKSHIKAVITAQMQAKEVDPITEKDEGKGPRREAVEVEPIITALPNLEQYIYCSSAGVYLKYDLLPHSESMCWNLKMQGTFSIVLEVNKKVDAISEFTDTFSAPARVSKTVAQDFPVKHLNILDPLRSNNNLGRSVSRGNFEDAPNIEAGLENFWSIFSSPWVISEWMMLTILFLTYLVHFDYF